MKIAIRKGKKEKGSVPGSVPSIDNKSGTAIRVVIRRPLRIEYAGAIYHVTNRGDRREKIFVDETDLETFLRPLSEACGKTGWEVQAWCIYDRGPYCAAMTFA